MDFKTAFLNGKLESPIDMTQLPGFEDPDHPDWVCKVSRSIYGLKQSPQEWNLELHQALINVGLTQSSCDPTLYFKLRGKSLIGAITVHVDNLAVVGEDEFVTSTIKSLGKKFKIGADSDLHHFLSLALTRNVEERLIYLSQAQYIIDTNTRFLAGENLTTKTPTDSHFKDLKNRDVGEDKAPSEYLALIGSLLWIARCTRPDTAFAVNKLSQFLKDPSKAHWEAGLRILRYLRTTSHLRLRLGGDLTCAGYSDADWAESKLNRQSTSAYTFQIGRGPISWRSKKQPTVSLSSTAAEYKAMSDSCKEALWLRSLLIELCLRRTTAIPLHVDNEGVEALAKNPEHQTRTKHIDTRYHFIRECVKSKKISIQHVTSQDMLADTLTKPLSRVLLEHHRDLMGLV